ncbi:hypothetical protein ACELLULO517_15700 [Acidisoma cellulosilytica]|uniref:Terminase n=1 Tax=Acidisoma cellulosilyticum TaxID=2802395 RepID=A0A963Z2K1_9PROT|nr:terminase family protein [Acidisoma cellulosilyticum]MCB8881692.1 hypothetical protein [Acidisoma cellulosilyticum]
MSIRKSKNKKSFIKREKLSKPQYEIYSWGWRSEARFRTAVCGRRFGKTFLAVEEIRRACREAVRLNINTDNEIWYGAPTFRQAKRVFWRRLKKGLPQSWLASKPNETDCSIVLKSGHVVRCVGLNEYDNLRGSGLWFFLGDEWQDAPPEAWTETIRPMLSTAGGHALFIGTPKGFNHFRDNYIDGQPGGEPDCKSWKYTTLEGGNVPADEVKQAQRTLDSRTFEQEYCADFKTFEGRIFYAFTRDANSNDLGSIRAKAYDPAKPIELGIDFNINPMSCAVLQNHDGADYQIDEIVIKTSNTDELVTEIRNRYSRNGSLTHITAYPDPAGAQRRTSAQGRTDISILQGSGMRVIAMSSHPLVRDRVNVANSRAKSGDGARRFFVDPRCKHSIDSYERHVYKDGTSEPDKGTGFDHQFDAVSYLLFGKYAYKPPQQHAINIMGR